MPPLHPTPTRITRPFPFARKPGAGGSKRAGAAVVIRPPGRRDVESGGAPGPAVIAVPGATQAPVKPSDMAEVVDGGESALPAVVDGETVLPTTTTTMTTTTTTTTEEKNDEVTSEREAQAEAEKEAESETETEQVSPMPAASSTMTITTTSTDDEPNTTTTTNTTTALVVAPSNTITASTTSSTIPVSSSTALTLLATTSHTLAPPSSPTPSIASTSSALSNFWHSSAGALAPHRGRRTRSLSPEDSETRVIDVDKVTMAELCRDIHIGRKSTVYERVQKIKLEEREARKRASRESAAERDERIKKESEDELVRRKKTAAMIESGVRSGNPKLKVINGKIIVDEDSLQIDRHERDGRDNVRPEDIELDDAYKRRVNSASWSKRERVERWTAPETLRFYDGLSMFGTDFGMMCQMFHGRSRRQLKNKYNAEERKNPSQVKIALSTRIPVSKDYLAQQKDNIL
ncbi:uncharacterized protein V1518DRAFT_412716 [Limtongia smithiae]|uniref:uncharacterized protein n=1 Tax=Limtongia smithiae TaxID=1125753 RepID=UPI0034CE4E40